MRESRVWDPTAWQVGADFPLEGSQLKVYSRGVLSHVGDIQADGSIEWECRHD